MDEITLRGLDYFGTTEKKGAEHNPKIVRMWKSLKKGFHYIKDDETAWCSAFANAITEDCGYEASDLPNAVSWLDVGTPIDKPVKGCVVVLWRKSKNSGYGHVGFYVNDTEDGKYHNLLGGNQKDKVGIDPYPKSRVLGYRLLKRIK